MNNDLDDVEKQKLKLLQEKVDKYQQDAILCANLTQEQSIILAELQTIFNIINNKTEPNVPSIYNNTCRSVKDAMKQFNSIYNNMESKQLYEIYVRKYREAKTGTDNTNELIKLLDLI